MKDYTYNRNFWRRIESKSQSRHKAKIILIIFIIGITSMLYFRSSSHNQNNVKGETIKQGKKLLPIIKKENNPNKLLADIKKEVSSLSGSFSVYVFDLTTGKNFGINEYMIHTAASVNKVPILASLYHLAEKGEIDLDKIIVPQETDIQDYGTGTIRYDPPGTPYSIKTLARLMMEKSDNTASYILGTLVIGLDRVQQLVNSWDMTQTKMIDNKTSAKDMAILMTKMYQGEITTEELTKEMLDFLEGSDFEDRIPAGIPENIKVYHKIGDEVGKIHDVGIVDIPDKPYFVGILTTDQTNEEVTKKMIAKISKMIYEYMNKL